jgi:hypothetical protein
MFNGFRLSVKDEWDRPWSLLMPDCHPAIFAKGKKFREEATPDERADVVMDAALRLGVDPSERGAWKQLWSELHARGGFRNANTPPKKGGLNALAFQLGLDFKFEPRKFVHLVYAEGDDIEGGSGVWADQPLFYPPVMPGSPLSPL